MGDNLQEAVVAKSDSFTSSRGGSSVKDTGRGVVSGEGFDRPSPGTATSARTSELTQAAVKDAQGRVRQMEELVRGLTRRGEGNAAAQVAIVALSKRF
jgi:hypothetical protein